MINELRQIVLRRRVIVNAQLVLVVKELKAFSSERLLELDSVKDAVPLELKPELLAPLLVHATHAVLIVYHND